MKIAFLLLAFAAIALATTTNASSGQSNINAATATLTEFAKASSAPKILDQYEQALDDYASTVVSLDKYMQTFLPPDNIMLPTNASVAVKLNSLQRNMGLINSMLDRLPGTKDSVLPVNLGVTDNDVKQLEELKNQVTMLRREFNRPAPRPTPNIISEDEINTMKALSKSVKSMRAVGIIFFFFFSFLFIFFLIPLILFPCLFLFSFLFFLFNKYLCLLDILLSDVFHFKNFITF